MKKLAGIMIAGALALSMSGCSASNEEAMENLNAAVARLETQLQEARDKEEIRNLVNQFSNLADEKDPAAQMELFTPDAEIIITMNGESRTMDYAQAEEAFTRVLTNTDSLYHMNGQVSLEVNGDTAAGTVYCRVVLVDENEEGVVMETDEGVIYHDDYVKQDGKWLISRRNSNFIYQDVKPLSGSR